MYMIELAKLLVKKTFFRQNWVSGSLDHYFSEKKAAFERPSEEKTLNQQLYLDL